MTVLGPVGGCTPDGRRFSPGWRAGGRSRPPRRDPQFGVQPATVAGWSERLVVPLVLVRVGLGELGQRLLEGGIVPEVRRHGKAVTRTCMGPGQRERTQLPVGLQSLWDHGLGVDRPLPVLQLAQVVVTADAVGALGALPPEEDVAARLHHALAGDHPRAMVAVHALLGEALQDRRLRLLGLQEQDVRRVGAVQEDHPGPGADAAHPDHLACHLTEPARRNWRGGRPRRSEP